VLPGVIGFALEGAVDWAFCRVGFNVGESWTVRGRHHGITRTPKESGASEPAL